MLEEKEMIDQMLDEGKISQEEAEKLKSALKKSYGLSEDQNLNDYVNNDSSENTEKERDAEEESLGSIITRRIKKSIDEKVGDNFDKKLKEGIDKSIDSGNNIIEEIKHLFNGFFGPSYNTYKEFEGQFDDDTPFIDLNNKNGRIEVKSWDNDNYKLELKLRVSADDEDEARELSEEIINIKQNEDMLKLDIDNVRGHRISVDILLFLPQEVKYKLNVESVNGKIEVRGLNFSTYKVKTSNGKIEVIDINASKGDIKGTNGKIDYQGQADEMYIETTNGKISVRPKVKGKNYLEVKTTNGVENIQLENETDFYLDGKVKTGNINLDLEDIFYKKQKEKLVKRHYIVYSKNWETAENKIQLKAKTTSGSIKVNQY